MWNTSWRMTSVPRSRKNNVKTGAYGVIVVSMNGQKIDMDLSLMKKYSKKDNPVMLSGYQFILGGIVNVKINTGNKTA